MVPFFPWMHVVTQQLMIYWCIGIQGTRYVSAYVSRATEIKAVHDLAKKLTVSDAAIFSIPTIIEFSPHLGKHENIHY
jgi:hypothetical protein